MTAEKARDLTRRARRFAAAFGLLILMCFSYEARGDSHESDDGTGYVATPEEDLSPGIKLRIESCGYNKPRAGGITGDDDDSGDDDDAADDDDATDDDDAADDDDATDDDDVTSDDDDVTGPDDDDDSAAVAPDACGDCNTEASLASGAGSAGPLALLVLAVSRRRRRAR